MLEVFQEFNQNVFSTKNTSEGHFLILQVKQIPQQTFVLMKTSWRRLEDVFRLRLRKTYSRCIQNVLVKTNIFVLSIRLQDVFKTSSRNLQDVLPRCLQDVFKTSSRLLANTSWRHLQDVLKTYRQIKLFLLTSLWEVFNVFVRRTAKIVVYRRILLGHTSETFMVSVQNSQVLVFKFTTLFSGCL